MPNSIMRERILEDGLDAVLSDDRIPVLRAVLGVETHEKWRIMNCQYYMKKETKNKEKSTRLGWSLVIQMTLLEYSSK